MRKTIEWSAFLMVAFGVWFVAGPSSLGGPASYVIVDGRSMEPTYQDGDLVVAYDRNTYDIGDVIVYDAPVDSQFNVIHRITDRTEGGFITQGDNRDEVDGWIAPDEEIYGAALFHIPRGGAVVTFLRQPAAILALLGGWITFLVLDARSKRRPADETPDPEGRSRPRRRRSAANPAAANENDRPTRVGRRIERRRRRERRRTAALLALGVLAGGSGGVVFAHAAVLHVDAGVLQAFHLRADLPPPEPERVTIDLAVHFFTPSGQEIGGGASPFETTLDMTSGEHYEVGWQAPAQPANSDVIPCDETLLAERLEGPTGAGTFLATEDASHVLCVQAAPAHAEQRLVFRVLDGDIGRGATTTDDLCEGHQDAPFCAGPSR
jgi:signal peptidase I